MPRAWVLRATQNPHPIFNTNKEIERTDRPTATACGCGRAAIHSFYTPSFPPYDRREDLAPLESHGTTGRGRSAVNGDMKNDFMQMSLPPSFLTPLLLSLSPSPSQSPFRAVPTSQSQVCPFPFLLRPVAAVAAPPSDYIVIFFIAFLSGCVRLEYWHLSCAGRPRGRGHSRHINSS